MTTSFFRRTRGLRLVWVILCVGAMMMNAAFAWTDASAASVSSTASSEAALTQYTLQFHVQPERSGLMAQATVRYTNQTGEPLRHVVFAIYANQFRRESTLPYDAEHIEAAFPNGYAPGGMALYAVTVDGQPADWGMQGDAESFLRVACSLAPGETCTFFFSYFLSLTDNCAFLGTGDWDWRLWYSYPVVCVYQYGEFQTNPATLAGRYAFTECADYQVTLRVPETFEVAATGQVTCVAVENGERQYEIIAPRARNVALAISRSFHRYTATAASGVTVIAYGRHRAQVRDALHTAVAALDAYERWLGPYPYETLTILESQCAAPVLGGCGVIAFSDALFTVGQTDERAFQVARAVAQQFLGEVVHANPAREGWISEAFGDYAALLFTEETDGYAAFVTALNQRVRPALQLTIPGGYSVDSQTAWFPSQRIYDVIVRERGAAVLHELRITMGRDAFLQAWRELYGANRWKIISIADLGAALSASYGMPMDETLLYWLYCIDEYANGSMDFYE